MSKYELTISPEYVRDWTFSDAIRELNQNAIDQQEIDINNTASCILNKKDCTIEIGSKDSSLKRSSLLLGNSTKSNNDETVGKYGEGYKLSLLVLARLGYEVEIHNYKKNEVWVPKIVKSRRYGCDILSVNITKHIFRGTPHSNLVFIIQNVKQKDFLLVVDTFLPLQNYNCIKTKQGEILTDKIHSGKVFINGLFVCECKSYGLKFGYNILPKYLSLDRDRKIIDTFNLTWLTSNMWSLHEDQNMVKDMVVSKVTDVQYISNFISGYTLANKLMDHVQNAHGLSAIPVDDENEKVDIENRYPNLKAVVYPDISKIVKENSSIYKSIVYHSTRRKSDNIDSKMTDITNSEIIVTIIRRSENTNKYEWLLPIDNSEYKLKIKMDKEEYDKIIENTKLK